MEILTTQFAPRVAGFRAGIHPHHALLRRHGAGTRGWKTVTHLKGREKALKPFGWTGRRAEWIVSDLPRLRGVHPRKVARFMDARAELLRRGMYADRAGLGRPGRPCPASGDRTSLPHPCPEPFAGCGRVSPSKRPMRRVEPERPRLRRTGLLAAPKAGEPAYPLGPRFAGPRQGLAEGCAPSNPPNGNGT